MAVVDCDAVSVADFDGDGDDDIAHAQDFGGTPGWLENLGGDAVAEPTLTHNPSRVSSLQAGDLDADGVPELIFISSLHQDVRAIDLRTGEPRTVANGAGWDDVVQGDIDGDGDTDLWLVEGWAESVGWAENRGPDDAFVTRDDGVDARQVQLTAGGDTDADGVAELIVFAWPATVLEYALGEDVPADVIPTPPLPAHAVFADFDADGVVDIVTAGPNGLFQFAASSPWSGGPLELPARNYTALHTADLDSDGRPDLVGSTSVDDASSLRVHRNLEDGWTDELLLTEGLGMVQAYDVDGDGVVEVVYGAQASFWAARWDGADFGHEVLLDGLPNPAPARGVVGDFDGDGDPDFLHNRGGDIHLMEATDRGWEDHVGFSEVHAWGWVSTRTADIDNDGLLDVVGGWQGPGMSPAQSGWWRNGGDGLSWSFRSLVVGPGAAPTHPVDLDGDGDADLLYGGWQTLKVQERDLNGWASAEPAGEAYFGHPLGAADLDGDDRAGLVVEHHGGIEVLYTNGGPSPPPEPTEPPAGDDDDAAEVGEELEALPPGDVQPEAGCICSASGGSGVWGLGLILLVGRRRR